MFLKDTFGKDENLLISDLLLVEYLTIDGKDFDNKKVKVSFEDLKVFKNLKYLEIANVTINNNIINILKDLNYLESIVFRNCKFGIGSKNLIKLSHVKNIRVISCEGFDISNINKMENLERLYISNDNITSLEKLKNLNLESLDISSCNIKSDTGLNKINVNYLVISNDQYNKFKKSIDKLKMKIMVMGDPSMGYYIEKWIN